MSQTNRKHRRMREEAGRPSPPTWPPSPAEQAGLAAELVGQAAYFIYRGDDTELCYAVSRLTADGGPAWRGAVERSLDGSLRATITALWGCGWQPADVLRVVARRLKPPHQDLVQAVIAAEASGYAAATVDQRWSAQLAEAGIGVWWPAELTAVQACARAHAAGWADFVGVALGLLRELVRLPQLESLIPIPGTATPTRPGPRPDVDERILARVRALLAKAESTTFPAEAETFTAGAQALMARHCIDHALLAATGRAPADGPTGRRIGIDNPYEAAKASLLAAVAAANRSRAVWTKTLGFATVVGHPADLDTVEVLFTSLLVQGTTAMTGEGSRASRGGGSRTRAFRQSFLVSYGYRIGERLTETTRQETEAAAVEPGKRNLLPVLASRVEAVERATAALFPQLKSYSTNAWDGEGWVRGRTAADLATLTPATPVTGPGA